MRSIFGRCIAIAMMAAIALVWQSPPAYAADLGDADDYRDMVRDAYRAAKKAAAETDSHADAADASADAAEDAAEDAETARMAAQVAEDDEAAEEAASAAEEAESRAMEEARAARRAADTAQKAADFSELDEEDQAGLTNDAKIAADNADLLYNFARVIALSNFGLGKEGDPGLTGAGSDHFLTGAGADTPGGLVARYNVLYPRDKILPITGAGDELAMSIAAAAGGTGTDDIGSTHSTNLFVDPAETPEPMVETNRDLAIEALQGVIAELIKSDWLEGEMMGAEGYQETAEEQVEIAEAAATEAAAQARIALAVTAQATVAAAAATAADKVAKDKEYADAVAASAADPSDVDKKVEVVKTKQAAADAATAATDAAKAAEKYAEAEPGDDDDDTMAGADDDDDDGDMMPMVTANGVGNLLKFSFWTTTADRDTLLAVTNPGYGPANVGVKIVDGMGTPAATFTICLGKGDVWTARLMSDGEGKSMLDIVNPGTCVSDMPTADMLPLAADHGFIEAYTTDDGMIMGTANIVSPMGGFSSIYNAVSLVNFDPMSKTKMADIQYALAMEGDVRKDMLIGRWAATPSNGAMTHVVLTFPAGGGPGTTPVRIHVTDQDGLSGSRDFMLGGAVNLCTFMTMDGSTTLSCNGGSALPLSSMGGWFKIMSPDMMGLPVIGMISTVYNGANGNFDQTAPIQWMEMMDMEEAAE